MMLRCALLATLAACEGACSSPDSLTASLSGAYGPVQHSFVVDSAARIARFQQYLQASATIQADEMFLQDITQ